MPEHLTRAEFVARAAGLSLALALPRGRVLHGLTVDPRVRKLEQALRGPVLTLASPGYDAARIEYNALYDGVHPLAIAQPLDAADVAKVVDWARTTHVPIVARSGG